MFIDNTITEWANTSDDKLLLLLTYRVETSRISKIINNYHYDILIINCLI